MSCGRILLVESDPRFLRLLEALLSGFPGELVIARSRAEALEASLRCRYALCLISHGLSDGSGLTLFPEVFGFADQATGVLLSQHPDLLVIQQALKAGYAAVWGKPPDTVQLSEMLRRVFGIALELGSSGESGMMSEKRLGSVSRELPTLGEIAGLSTADIRERLSTAELIGIIRAVEYPFAGKERLEYFDRDTLERVVCLVRRWGQQRLERLRATRGAEYSGSASVAEEFVLEEVAVVG